MTTLEISGKQIEVPAGAIAYKYADPTEGARWVYEQSDADDIRREDSSLLVIAPETLADLDLYDAKAATLVEMVRADDGSGGWSLHDATTGGLLSSGPASWDAAEQQWDRPNQADFAAVGAEGAL